MNLEGKQNNYLLTWINYKTGTESDLMLYTYPEGKITKIAKINVSVYKLNLYKIDKPLISPEYSSEIPSTIYSWRFDGKALSFVKKNKNFQIISFEPFSNKEEILYESQYLLLQPLYSPSENILIYIEKDKNSFKIKQIKNSDVKELFSTKEKIGNLQWHKSGEWFYFYKELNKKKISLNVFSIAQQKNIYEIYNVTASAWLNNKAHILVLSSDNTFKEFDVNNLKFMPVAFNLKNQEKSDSLEEIARIMKGAPKGYSLCKVNDPLKVSPDDDFMLNLCFGGLGGIKFEAREIYFRDKTKKIPVLMSEDSRDFKISPDGNWILIAGYRSQGCMNVVMKNLKNKSQIIRVQDNCPKGGIACVQPEFKP